MPSWRRLAWHFIRRAAPRADCTAGSRSAISRPMIAMVTSSSISVNARRFARMASAPRPAGHLVGVPIHRACVVIDECIVIWHTIVVILVRLELPRVIEAPFGRHERDPRRADEPDAPGQLVAELAERDHVIGADQVPAPEHAWRGLE